MAGTAAVLAAACFWKYRVFRYNAIDLAYFNQVFWNTVHGRPFSQSIHPHLSLGDHAELAILPLSILYALWQDPRMLLLLQAIALVLPAYAIWRLAAIRLAKKEGGRRRTFALAPLVLALAYLCNPIVHNIALFEFHVLPFALAPLLMAMLAYEEGRKGRFIAWIALALLVREDVALVVVMLGALAWMERKPSWWRITPAVVGAAWFAAAMGLIAHFSPDGGYKYHVYYAWLGSGAGAMLVNALRHPLAVLAHVTTLANLEMVLGFLMPVLFLPALAPARLALALGPLLQIVLGAPGGGELIIDTHYATLFLPALMLASIEGLAALPVAAAKITTLASPGDARRFAYVLLPVASLYGAFTLGPLPSVLRRALFDEADATRAAAVRSVIAEIPRDASVAASYALLPALSSREKLASLHYAFLGVTQFAEKPYVPPADIEYAALEADDLLTYRTQFLKTAWAAPHYQGGIGRLKALLGAPILQNGTLALYRRGAAPINGGTGYFENEEVGYVLEAPYMVNAGARISTDPLTRGRTLVVSTRWRFESDLGTDAFVVRATAAMTDGRVLSAEQPLVGPAPFSAKIDGGYETTFRFPVRETDGPGGEVTVSLEEEDAAYQIDGIRAAERAVTEARTLDIGVVPVK